MKDNQDRGELDPVHDICRCCNKNSLSVLSCIGKTKEGCDRGSKVGTVHCRQDGEERVPQRKPKVSGRRESCEKDLFSKKSSGSA